ncbi:MAG: hypothetical protein AAF335_02350 [Bacteroidota bacterium]
MEKNDEAIPKANELALYFNDKELDTNEMLLYAGITKTSTLYLKTKSSQKKEEEEGKKGDNKNEGLSLWWAVLPIIVIVVCGGIYALSQKVKGKRSS